MNLQLNQQIQPAPPGNGGAAAGLPALAQLGGPPAQAAPAQAQAVGGLPAPQVYHTFGEYFQDEARDPLRRTWVQVLRRFDDATTAAETLLSAAVNMPVAAPCAYL
jgi:hypothetical protein